MVASSQTVKTTGTNEHQQDYVSFNNTLAINYALSLVRQAQTDVGAAPI
jgi:hypothetical protein